MAPSVQMQEVPRIYCADDTDALDAHDFPDAKGQVQKRSLRGEFFDGDEDQGLES